MKIKFITWKSNGNDVALRTKENFEQISYNGELLKLYSTPDDIDPEQLTLVAEYKGVYFYVGTYFKDTIEHKLSTLIDLFKSDETVKNYIDNSFWFLIHVEVLKTLGEEFEYLLVKRQERIEKMKLASQKREQLRQEKELQQQKEYENEVKEITESVLNDLSENKMVLCSDLIIAMNKLNFKMPIRTKGSMMNQSSMKISTDRVSHYTKGTSNKTLSSYFNQVQSFLKFTESVEI